jgi:hypothetical protein
VVGGTPPRPQGFVARFESDVDVGAVVVLGDVKAVSDDVASGGR